MTYYRALCSYLGAEECFATPDSCAQPMSNAFPAEGTGGTGPLFYLDRDWSGPERCKPHVYSETVALRA